MPKLPRGMFLREGRGYYTRRWADGKDRWIALGKDFDEACRKLRNAEKREVPVVRLTVKEAAAKWLESYVATARAPKQRVMAAQRVRDYLEPYMGTSCSHGSRKTTCGRCGCGWRGRERSRSRFATSWLT